MPFDFLNYKHYSINYSNLLNILNSQQILSERNIQIQYLKRWMEVLEYHDNIIKNELRTSESILELKINLASEPEIFQLPMYHQNIEVLLHFRASIANQIISMYKGESQFIPLDEFVKENSQFNWTPVNAKVDTYSSSKKPIIMVPFLNNQYSYLVIDGNHRLTYKTKNNINDIHALIISEQTVIEHSLFSSSFDKFYYIMFNEINHMANATHYKKANAFQLIQKSYLTDGKFKFLDE